jgi:hypothetical protein
MPKRRSPKSLDGFRRRFRGDLRHALRCCEGGRLPRSKAAYLRGALEADKLPAPREVSKRIGLTFEQRESNRLFTIPPIDKTKAEIMAIRREKDRERKARTRRKAGIAARQPSKTPWVEEGVSRASWYRRRAKVRRECPDLTNGNETRVSEGETRKSAEYLNIPRTQQSHPPSPNTRSRRLACTEEPASSSPRDPEQTELAAVTDDAAPGRDSLDPFPDLPACLDRRRNKRSGTISTIGG